MDDKYYTPTIEEFHVGFEYEYLNIKSVWVKSNDFSNEYDYEDSPLYGVIKGIEDTEVRVKYLDKEDIEGFSKTNFPEITFKYDNNAEPIPGRKDTFALPKAYFLDDQLYSGQLWILYHWENDNVVWIEYIKDCAGEGYLFKGVIKNKSELKRILKMIGV
jgi:hypothetical protein